MKLNPVSLMKLAAVIGICATAIAADPVLVFGIGIGTSFESLVKTYPTVIPVTAIKPGSRRYELETKGTIGTFDLNGGRMEHFSFVLDAQEAEKDLVSLAQDIEARFASIKASTLPSGVKRWIDDDNAIQYDVTHKNGSLTVDGRRLGFDTEGTNSAKALDAAGPEVVQGAGFEAVLSGVRYYVKAFDDGSVNIARCQNGDGSIKSVQQQDLTLLLGLSCNEVDAFLLRDAILRFKSGERGSQLGKTARYSFGTKGSGREARLTVMKVPRVDLFQPTQGEWPFFISGPRGDRPREAEFDRSQTEAVLTILDRARQRRSGEARQLDTAQDLPRPESNTASTGRANLPVQPATASEPRPLPGQVVWSRPLPASNYLEDQVSDLVAKIVETSRAAHAELDGNEGRKDLLGIKQIVNPEGLKKGAEAGLQFNDSMKGKPFRLHGRFIKASTFLGKRLVFEQSPGHQFTVSLRNESVEPVKQLKTNDLVEVIGKYEMLGSKLGIPPLKWELRLDAGEIISIRRE